MQGEAETGDFFGISRAWGEKKFVTKAEVAVLLSPVDLRGQNVEHVTIENRPCQDVIARYDRPHTFFNLDPRYYGMKVYRFNFEPKDFDEMAAVLAGIKGRFLMSLNDHKAVGRIFKNFMAQPVSLRYSCMGKPSSRDTERRELLICNY